MKNKFIKIRFWIWYRLYKIDLVCDIMEYLRVEKSNIASEVHLADICADPMNGCPGDFAEDGPEVKQFMWKIEMPKWIEKICDYNIKIFEKNAWAEHRKLLRFYATGK